MDATAKVLWAGLGWLVVFAISFGIVFAVRRPSRVDKVAIMVGLPLPPELREVAAGLQRSSNVGAAVSTGIGVIAAAGILIATRATSVPVIFGGYLLIIMVALGAGVTVIALSRESRRQDVSVRFARLRAVTLRDYETPLRSWGPRAAVALLTLGLVIRAITSPNPAAGVPLPLLVYGVATIATLVMSEIAKRQIIARGQPAGSTIELAWDDAIKGQAIYSLGIAPLFLGAYGGMLVNLFDIGIRPHGTQAIGLGTEAGLALVGLVINVVVLVGDAAAKPQQRYRRRLWPEFAQSASAPTAPPSASAQPSATAAP